MLPKTDTVVSLRQVSCSAVQLAVKGSASADRVGRAYLHVVSSLKTADMDHAVSRKPAYQLQMA